MLTPADLIAGKLLVQLGDVPFEQVRRHAQALLDAPDPDAAGPVPAHGQPEVFEVQTRRVQDLVTSLAAAGLLRPEQVRRIRRYVALFWQVRQDAVTLWLAEHRRKPAPGLVDELLARLELGERQERMLDLLVEAGVVDAPGAHALEAATAELLEAENRRLIETYAGDGLAGLARPLIPRGTIDTQAFRVSVLFRDASTRERVEGLVRRLRRPSAPEPTPPAASRLDLSASWDGESSLHAYRQAPGPAGAELLAEPGAGRATVPMDPLQVLVPPDQQGTRRARMGQGTARMVPPGPAAALPSGSAIGAYTVLHLIGQGAMGAVYLCTAPNGGMVAVKTLLANLAAPDDWARFEREAALCGLLRHSNTVGLIDRGATPEGVHYLVMPPYVGRPLRALVEEQGCLEPALALHYAEEILVGLAHIHEAGVVHRDLKPENVIVLAGHDQRRIKIVDFGIARAIGVGALPAEALFRTSAGIVTGSPAYVAPETILGDPFDARTDLYSLGVVLFELLAGRVPFLADTASEFLLLHLAGVPPQLGYVRPDVDWPESLEQLLQDLMARERLKRPPSARAVLERLRALREPVLRELALPPERPRDGRWLKRVLGG